MSRVIFIFTIPFVSFEYFASFYALRDSFIHDYVRQMLQLSFAQLSRNRVESNCDVLRLSECTLFHSVDLT